MASASTAVVAAAASNAGRRLRLPGAGSLFSYGRRWREQYAESGRALAAYDLHAMDEHPAFKAMLAQRPWVHGASHHLDTPYAPASRTSWAKLSLPGRGVQVGAADEATISDQIWGRTTSVIGDLFTILAGPALKLMRLIFKFQHPYGPEERLQAALWEVEHRGLAHMDRVRAAEWRTDLDSVRDALARAHGPARVHWLVAATHSMDRVLRKFQSTCEESPLVTAAMLPTALAMHVPLLRLVAAREEVGQALQRWREVVQRMRHADFAIHRRQYIVRSEPKCMYLINGQKRREERAEAKDLFYGDTLRVTAHVKVHYMVLDPSEHSTHLEVKTHDGVFIFKGSKNTDWAANLSLPTASRVIEVYEEHEVAKAVRHAQEALDSAEELCAKYSKEAQADEAVAVASLGVALAGEGEGPRPLVAP